MMARWQRKILLQPEWGRAKNGDLPMNELAGAIAAKLKRIRPFGDEYVDTELENIVEEFESAAGDTNLTGDDLDYIMRQLYDWGDMRLDDNWNGRKVCWIDCFKNAEAA